MRRSVVILFAIAALVELCASIAGAQKTSVQTNSASPQPVTVSNTPLPVKGTVNASVTGAVNATITNTVPVTGAVNATITNTVPVTGTVNANITGGSVPITLDSSTPLNATITNPVLWIMDATAQNAVQLQAEIDIPVNTHGFRFYAFASSSSAGATYTVPTGKRLVVNSVSLRAEIDPSQQISAHVETAGTGVSNLVFLEPHLVCTECEGLSTGPPDEYNNTFPNHYVANSNAPYYVDAGQNVRLIVFRKWYSDSYHDTFYMRVQGYLIDVPPTP